MNSPSKLPDRLTSANLDSFKRGRRVRRRVVAILAVFIVSLSEPAAGNTFSKGDNERLDELHRRFLHTQGEIAESHKAAFGVSAAAACFNSLALPIAVTNASINLVKFLVAIESVMETERDRKVVLSYLATATDKALRDSSTARGGINHTIGACAAFGTVGVKGQRLLDFLADFERTITAIQRRL